MKREFIPVNKYWDYATYNMKSATIKARQKVGDFSDIMLYDTQKNIYKVFLFTRKRDGYLLIDGYNVTTYTRKELPQKYKDLTY